MLLKAIPVVAALGVALAGHFVAADEPTPFVPNTWMPQTKVPALGYSTAYSVVVTDNDREAYFYMRKLNTSAADSDPDLFVGYQRIPTHKAGEYDGHDQRIVDVHEVRLNRDETATLRQLKTGTYNALAYGYENFESDVDFRVELYSCRNKDCGKAQNAGTCAPATGVCTCAENWRSDAFCSSEIVTAAPATKYERALEAGATVYYKFPALPDSGYELLFTGSRKEAIGQGYIIAALGRLPTLADNDAKSTIYWGDLAYSLRIPNAMYVGGDWIVAVIAPKTVPMSIAMQGELHHCPAGCSGHGKCDDATSTCKCDEGFESQKDCSLSATSLTHQEPVSASIQAGGRVHFSVTVPEAYAQADIEMAIHLDAEEEDPNKSYASMYLLHEGMPHEKAYDLASSLPAQQKQSIYVPSAKLTKGVYTLAIESRSNLAIKYKISLIFDPHCPASCGVNGRCSALGVCVCNEGWIGRDCQINSKKCQEEYGLVSNGLSAGYVFLVVILSLIVGGGLGAFVGRKYASPPAQQDSMPQYNELNA